MNERTRKGLDVLEAALLMGLLGDALLRATPWGANVLLWTGALAAAIVLLLARWQSDALKDEGRWLLLAILFSASAYAWRDSLTLRFLDFLSLLVALGLLAWRAKRNRLRLAGVLEYAWALVCSGLAAPFAILPLVLRDVHWKEVPRAGWSRHAWAVLRGLIIAVPLLFIFGLLFMAADAVFEGLVNKTFHVDLDTVFTHIFLVIFFSWVVGGYLRGMLLGKEGSLLAKRHASSLSLGLSSSAAAQEADASGEQAQTDQSAAKDEGARAEPGRPLSLGIVEVGVVLGLINLLFLSFVLVQVRYFFGGAAHVEASTGLTYAEYARRGFFELVTVGALSLPLLLFAHWLLRKERAVHEHLFRALAGMQLALLFVIMTSALARMRLYQSEYGLTELRLYTTAFMGWLALVFVWFALTVLRSRRERFASGALVAGFLIIALLHLFNPDALIVRVNVAQAQDGHGFDALYATSLSADAVPALVEALPAMSQSNRCHVAASLGRRWGTRETTDWRTWNWSRREARRLALGDQASLETVCPHILAPVIPVETGEAAKIPPD